MGRGLRRDEGSALTEFAVAATLLFAVMIGIVQVSFILYDYNYVNDAARQGSRYAMVRGSTSCSNTPGLSNCNATAAEIQTWVQSLGYPGITGSSVTVTTTWCTASSGTPTTWGSCSGTTSNAPGNLVKVTASYPLSLGIPFSKKLSLSVSSTSEMVISQ